MTQPTNDYSIVAYPNDGRAPFNVLCGEYHEVNQQFTYFESAGSQVDYTGIERIELHSHMLTRATQRWQHQTIRRFTPNA